LPPGGGKTVIAAFIAARFAARSDSVSFNCHRAELLQQTSLTFTRCGVAHGFVAAGHARAPSLVNVCSIDTLKNRIAQLTQPKCVLWDECHHIGAAGWAAIMAQWPDAFHIGLTGTPWRLDGTGLGEFFDVMVEGPTPAELIAMGALSPYRIFAPPGPDMAGVRRAMGDFAKGEAEARMDKPKLTGDIIAHWRKHANGLRTVGYGVTRAHSHHLAEQFRAAGIPAAHLDGDTPKGERRQIIQDYARGELRVLFNVDLFGEGFDLSAIAQTDVTIDCVIQGRPTQSLSLDLQQKMRCMRPSPGKVGIILDHAGNSQRHGFPDDDREWSLEGRERRRNGASDVGPPPPITCEGCFMQIRRPTPPCCPSCGKRLQAEAKPIEVGDGELVEVTEAEKDAMRRERKREEHDAKTLQELVALAARRGYKNPQKWAFMKWSNSRWRG
jgi:superfamily II DNA or RNA helicase